MITLFQTICILLMFVVSLGLSYVLHAGDEGVKTMYPPIRAAMMGIEAFAMTATMLLIFYAIHWLI